MLQSLIRSSVSLTSRFSPKSTVLPYTTLSRHWEWPFSICRHLLPTILWLFGTHHLRVRWRLICLHLTTYSQYISNICITIMYQWSNLPSLSARGYVHCGFAGNSISPILETIALYVVSTSYYLWGLRSLHLKHHLTIDTTICMLYWLCFKTPTSKYSSLVKDHMSID